MPQQIDTVLPENVRALFVGKTQDALPYKDNVSFIAFLGVFREDLPWKGLAHSELIAYEARSPQGEAIHLNVPVFETPIPLHLTRSSNDLRLVKDRPSLKRLLGLQYQLHWGESYVVLFCLAEPCEPTELRPLTAWGDNLGRTLWLK